MDMHAAGQYRALMMGCDDSCNRDVADGNEGDYVEVDDKWHSDILKIKYNSALKAANRNKHTGIISLHMYSMPSVNCSCVHWYMCVCVHECVS